MKSSLERFFPIGEAIGLLLFPHAEIIIHDLKQGTIAMIYNNLSKRKIGEESLLDEAKDHANLPEIFPPYLKTNWDGRKMKSVSALLKDEKNTPIGLLCINLDLSKWESMSRLISEWLQVAVQETQPEALFKDDWRERINAYVSQHLLEKKTSLGALGKKEKKELVRALYKNGAFGAKNAANYIADILSLSRATIYNYLRK